MDNIKYNFFRGLECPSFLVWPLVGLNIVLLLAALELIFTSGYFTKLPESLYLRNSKDIYTHHSYVVGSLKINPPKKPMLYFFGGSSMAWAVKAHSLEEKIRKNSGLKYGIHNFAFGRQTFGEIMAITDNLPESSGTVVIGLVPSLFSRQVWEYVEPWRAKHLLLESPTLRQFLVDEQQRHLIPNPLFSSILWRIKDHLWANRKKILKLKIPTHQFSAGWFNLQTLDPDEKSKWVRSYYQRQSKHYAINSSLNFRALRRLVESLEQRGLRTVLMQLPLNPDETSIDHVFLNGIYEHEVNELSEELSLPYWKFQRTTLFTSSDFRDAIHLLQSGRKKYEESLTAQIKRFHQVDVSS